MANRALIEKDIKEYCIANNINDVSGFITQCMLRGFNIFRYGLSPGDNIKRQNGEIIDNGSNRTNKKKEEASNKNIINKDKVTNDVNTTNEPVIVKRKRKITVTNID